MFTRKRNGKSNARLDIMRIARTDQFQFSLFVSPQRGAWSQCQRELIDIYRSDIMGSPNFTTHIRHLDDWSPRREHIIYFFYQLFLLLLSLFIFIRRKKTWNDTSPSMRKMNTFLLLHINITWGTYNQSLPKSRPWIQHIFVVDEDDVCGVRVFGGRRITA